MSFPKFVNMTKNTPFFPILHVFAPLNDVSVYTAWSWKTTLMWIFYEDDGWYPTSNTSAPPPTSIFESLHTRPYNREGCSLLTLQSTQHQVQRVDQSWGGTIGAGGNCPLKVSKKGKIWKYEILSSNKFRPIKLSIPVIIFSKKKFSVRASI